MGKCGRTALQPKLYMTSKFLLAIFIFSLAGGHARQVGESESRGSQAVPRGYEFLGMVEFTENPNHGRPHLNLASADGDTEDPSEAQHTLLITPDGRAYKKLVSQTLEDFHPDVFQPSAAPRLPPAESQPPPDWVAFEPALSNEEPSSTEESSAEGQAISRRLKQVNQVAGPSASIGVTVTNDDLGCNGCGPDNRVQVTDTTVYPFMTVGRLIGQLGTSTFGLECTGTLIGNSHVLTAAHCVFDINASRKMVSNLNFAPALNGGRAPYGTLQWTQARILSQFSNQPGYTTTAMNYDFALVTLASAATSGYLSLYVPPGTRGTSSPSLTTAGYPGSKASGTMWRSACGNTSIDYSTNNAFANVAQCGNGRCSNILTHTCISSDGQSGSGMWDDDNQLRAILTGKVTVSNGDAYNVATEVDTEVYNQIASWYNEDQDSAGNGTLPLAPSGPGSQPASDNAFVRWFKDNWGKNWFVAVVIIVCVAVAGVLFLLLLQFIRCCCGQSPQPVKPSPAYAARPPQIYPQGYPQGSYPPSGYPSRTSGYYQSSHMNYPTTAAAYR